MIARNLYNHIRENADSGRPIRLANLAYTLQVGREAMDERVALQVDSIEELQDKLKKFIERELPTTGIYRGRRKDKTDILALLVSEGDLSETVNKWMDEGKYDRLANLWVSGVSIDWSRMYLDSKPVRISLPTYPFERNKYWVPETKTVLPATAPAGSMIHPLLHENTSTFSEQRFCTTFTGEEPFLRDHRVKGKAVLPGVAHLEMARAGIEQASQIGFEDAIMVVRNVVWSRPVTVDGGEARVHLSLSADESGRISYEICGEGATNGDGRVGYSQGTVVLRSAKRQHDSAQAQERTEPPRLDLASLEQRCGGGSLEPEECYEIYGKLGLDYGPAYRGIEKIYVGRGEALAKLRLPSAVSNDDKYVLHPSMMDAAVQAAIGVYVAEGGGLSSVKPALPFALDEMEVFGRTTEQMWAHIRASEGSAAGGKVRKLDIDVCDEGGKLCARLKGWSTRELGADKTGLDGEVGTFLLEPVWDRVEVEGNPQFPKPASAMVMVGGSEELEQRIRQHYGNTQRLQIDADDTIEEIGERIRAVGSIDHLLWVVAAARVSGVTDEALITAQREGVLLGFRLIKALLREGFGSKRLGITVITTNSQRIRPEDVVDPAHASIHGFIGTVAKEYPGWQVRLVDMEAPGEWAIAEIFRVPADPQGDPMVYRRGAWYKQQLARLTSREVVN